MKRFVFLSLFTAILAPALVTTSAAAEEERWANPILGDDKVWHVAPAKPTHIYLRAVFDPQMCQMIGMPNVRLLSAPTHGRLERVEVIVRLRGGRCDGLGGPAIRFTYTPDTGFAGEDEFVVEATSPLYRAGTGYSKKRHHYRFVVAKR